MNKKYFKGIDNLTPSQSALNRALEAARAEEQSGKVIKMKTTRKKFTLLGAVAASLALIITLGAVFFPSSVPTDKKAGENTFFITANAAELKNQLSDKSVIGAFEGSAETARLADFDNSNKSDLYDTGQFYKDGYADFFMLYDMSKLSVKGDNIKSVSAKSNKKGVYFAVTATGDIEKNRTEEGEVNYVYENGKAVSIGKKSYEEYEKSCKERLGRYTDADSFKNSQYTKNELKKFGDGIYANIFCDGFTYNNEKGEKSVNLGGDLSLVIESNHSNSKIAKWLKELNKVEKQIIKRKYSSENYNDLDRCKDSLYSKIIKETVQNSDIDVTVTFTDGTVQTRTLEIDCYMDKEIDFPWITIK